MEIGIWGDSIYTRIIKEYMEKLKYEEKIQWTENLLEKDFDSIVFINKGQNDIEILNAIKFALKRNIPMLTISIDFDKILIGPLFVPNLTGCYMCFCERVKINHADKILPNKVAKVIEDECRLWDELFLSIICELVQNELVSYARYQKSIFENKVYILKKGSNEFIRKSFIPYEFCKACSGMKDDVAEDSIIDLEKEELKPDFYAYRLKENMDIDYFKSNYMDFQSGLINHIYKDINSNLLPMVGVEYYTKEKDYVNRAFGRNYDYLSAEKSALLEALERYSTMTPRGKRTKVYATYQEVMENAIDPRKFCLHEEKQRNEQGYELIQYCDSLKINWVWGFSIRNHKPILIPEQIIYYDVEKFADKTKGSRFIYETSNGAAVGGSLQEAILYAIFEVIERDAFLVSWYNRLQLTEIDLGDDIENKNITLMHEMLKNQGYDIHFFDMTMENKVPSIWGLMINPDKNALVKSYTAAGAHINPEKALEGAMIEVVTSLPIYEKLLPAQRKKAYEMLNDSKKVTKMEDHVLLYSIPEAVERFSFLFEKKNKKKMSELYQYWYENVPSISLTQELNQIIENILKYHEDIIVVNLENEVLSRQGLHAVKVVIPSMLTMTFGQQYRRLNYERILTGPVISGYRREPIKREKINLDPHPFP